MFMDQNNMFDSYYCMQSVWCLNNGENSSKSYLLYNNGAQKYEMCVCFKKKTVPEQVLIYDILRSLSYAQFFYVCYC